jgi:hypothetical protein
MYSTKDWLTVAQLVGAWGPELGRGVPDPSRVEADLVHELVEDIINGRFDNSGPFCEGQRLGLRLITPDCRAGFLVGNDVRDLIRFGIEPWLLHRIVVMKEAILDFARRRQLPPPSWWDTPVGATADGLSVSADTTPISVATLQNPTPAISGRRRGPRPWQFERIREEMRKDIRQRRRTVTELQNMREKELASQYRVSRDTARKARQAVLSESEFVERQIATNDK